MAWVIEMSESRKERRTKDLSDSISKVSLSTKSSKLIDNITDIIIWVFIVGGICLLLTLTGFTKNQTYMSLLTICGSIFIGIGSILLILAPIYKSLDSIKNYLRSIDEKLDQ